MFFKNPEYLYFLCFLPVLIYLFILRVRFSKNIMRKYFNSQCLKSVNGNKYFISVRFLKQLVFLISLLFIIVSLSRPGQKNLNEKIEVHGAEVMILVDVSNSMKVKDMPPLDRESAMKKDINQLIHLLSGHRVGLIAFAGSATLLSPLTLDHSTLNMLMASFSQTYVQGTNFGAALRLAWQALKRGSASGDSSAVRVILVASDGEDNEQEAMDMAKALSKEGVRIFTLGFGTKKGGVIPIYDKNGNKLGYKKDKNGDPVVSRFNESTLKNIARVSEGAFYASSFGTNTVNKIYKDIQALGEGKISHMSAYQYKENYQLLALIALCFGFLFFFIDTHSKRRKTMWHSYLEKNE